jgi:hypothetical protein
MAEYLPWDKSWHRQIIYLPWIQPEMPGMEHSPVLPAYPFFLDALKNNLDGYGFYTAVASAMVFLLGHEPESAVNPLYCAWLRVFNTELATQLLYEGTEMMAKYNFTQAIWMLQASLLLEPESHETNYNLALVFNNLAEKLAREEKYMEASECYSQAQQYFQNALQLEHTGGEEGKYRTDEGTDEGYGECFHKGW